jgi:hypothetical protein
MRQNYSISMGPMGHITDEMCRITVLRGHAIFHIKVTIAQVEDTSFGRELLQQLELWEARPRGRARDKPIFDLIYQHCLPLLEILAPHTSLQDLSLEAFLHSPTYNLELVSGGNDRDIRIKGEDEHLFSPAFFISAMRTADLPESCTAASYYQARDIWIAPTIEKGKSLDTIQGKVVTADGAAHYFKPRQEWREKDFERELCTLAHIDEVGLSTVFRVPKLHCLVLSDENTIIGILMTLINSSEIGTHLRCPGLQERSELHDQWEKQLTETVQGLHDHGIVWGDVHPMNVVIDEELNAWTVDFGGKNNIEFVDDDKCETMEGDWQGLTRIFREWLPSLQRRSKW